MSERLVEASAPAVLSSRGRQGLTADSIFAKYREWTQDLSAEEQTQLWHGTAAKFYRLG